MDPIDTWRIFYPTATEYIFLPSVHRTFSIIDHMLGHQVSLNKFKKTEIIATIFFQLLCNETRNQEKKMENLQIHKH